MIVQNLAVRVSAYADAIAARGGDARVLTALGAFLAEFGAIKPTALLAAAETTLEGPPLPDGDAAVFALEAARELKALHPLLVAWRCPKASIGVALKLTTLFAHHPDWSLRSIQILALERLKQTGALPEPSADDAGRAA